MEAESEASPETGLASARDQDSWNDFVGRSCGASFSHRFEWLGILRRAYRKRCYYLWARQRGEWIGVLPLVHMKGLLGGNLLVSLPFLDQGGILAESDRAATALYQAALRQAGKSGAAGLELRGPAAGDLDEATEARRYRFILPLDGSEEDLWKRIGPKVRNQIRKSEKSGLETRRLGADGVDRFYSVFARNMRDLGSPVHSRRFFEEILSSLGTAAQVYLVLGDRGRAVAGAVAVRFGDRATVPWASSLRSARAACPNHALYWRVLRDAREDGVRDFDFGRSSVGTGTFRFKKQWKAKAEPLHWHSCDRHGRLQAERMLNPRDHALLAGLWRRMPVSLATAVGPWVRRQLAN